MTVQRFDGGGWPNEDGMYVMYDRYAMDIARLEKAIDEYRIENRRLIAILNTDAEAFMALEAELATEREHEQGWIDDVEAAQAWIKKVEGENERLLKRVDHLSDISEIRIERARCAEAERDRYRDLLEKLAAGKFESGDHAQELAADTLGGNCKEEDSGTM